jgi:hypothetical protein
LSQGFQGFKVLRFDSLDSFVFDGVLYGRASTTAMQALLAEED